jgi:1-acyl-sn-glycerol-3-phosphate acyltransferase
VIRALWAGLVGGVVTAVLAAQIVVANWLGRTRVLAKICPRNPTWSARVFLWAAGVKVDVEGAERLRGEGPRVLVANHESWFDVFALCASLPLGYRFAVKKELEKVPIWGAAWIACGHISVDRHNRQAAIQSIERARALSGGEQADMVIVFFPEGTRTETGALLPFKKGAFVLALQLGVPIIPVAVIGGRQVMPKHSLRIRPGRMRVVVGDPIPVEGLGFEKRDALLEQSRAAIVQMRGGEGPTTAP